MRKLSARLEGMSQQENSEVSRWTRLLHAQLTRFCQVWSSLLGWLPPDWRAAGLPSLAWLSQADTLQPDSPPFRPLSRPACSSPSSASWNCG
ncbi:hypothetical protein VRB76_11225 [Erwinia aphidicola]